VEKKYKTITAICTTTINVPKFFEDVCQNANKFNHKDLVFLVIGDYKTPKIVGEYLKKLENKYNLPFEYYNVEAQKSFLKDYPELDKLLPYNSGGRKLLANFICIQRNYERVIMLDDDNFVRAEDFFKFHKNAGKNIEIENYSSNNGWYNVYESLIEKKNIFFYPRSFPWRHRFKKNIVKKKCKISRIGVINGLVLNDPDIDAISRLFWPIYVTGIKKQFLPQFALENKTWCSWNNQNTSISSTLLPCYFTPPSIGRNSDIWTAYVLCKICDFTGDKIAFGQPIVEQVRNPHNLFQDLEDEIINNISTDYFCNMLKDIKITEFKPLLILKELLLLSQEYLKKNIAEDKRINLSISKYVDEYLTWTNFIIKNYDFI
tara:strand:+ start:1430 stop:2554 length:1125 start_codon:yes stop_codon:yes gene_type:complete